MFRFGIIKFHLSLFINLKICKFSNLSRFSGASKEHKDLIVAADYDGTIRTEIYTGRPMRIIKNPYAEDWAKRPTQMQELLKSGKVNNICKLKQNFPIFRMGKKGGICMWVHSTCVRWLYKVHKSGVPSIWVYIM